MSIALRTKLRSLPAAHLLSRSFSSSIGDGAGRPEHPPDPIPNRPLRGRPHSSPANPRVPPNSNRIPRESDADFLEMFKLGFDPKSENPKTAAPAPPVIADDKEEPLPPPQDAEEIFKKMKETGLIPNAVSMLDGLCKNGLVKEAMSLFGLMREKGTIPEVVVYTSVVEGFCKAHKFDDAIRIFKKMQTNGVVPNVFSYQVLVRGLCSGKRLDDAYAFTVEMLEAGHSPNLATFTGLVDGYCRARGLEDAKNVIGEMRDKGFLVKDDAVRKYLDKNGPFSPSVWEAILGNKASKRSLF